MRSGWLWTSVYTTLCVLAVACGGAQKGGGDHYQASVTKQRACCSELGDPSERAVCIDGIVTVDDLVDEEDSAEVKSSAVNQATFRCMSDNFVCDPGNGQATAASRQAQLDCVNDISGQ